jgi:hypothetical protein
MSYYSKGLNNDYLLAKHTPELMQKLTASIQPESDYLQVMLSGEKQHEIEYKRRTLKKILLKHLTTKSIKYVL